MKVRIKDDYICFKKGEVYEVKRETDDSIFSMYINCPSNDYGYKPHQWGFMDKDDIKQFDWLEIIDDEEDVEHNAHYKACAIEPWDIMEANFTSEEFIGFLKGNCQKYLSRIGRKGQDLDDCDKIIVYAKKLKEVLNNSTRKELREQD